MWIFWLSSFSSFFDLAPQVSSYSEGLQSHVWELPLQLPPWCYVICVLHQNRVFPLVLWPLPERWVWLLQNLHLWGFWEFQQCPHIPVWCTAPTQLTCTNIASKSFLTLELTLLLLISLKSSFISITSYFRSFRSFFILIPSVYSIWLFSLTLVCSFCPYAFVWMGCWE